MSVRRAAFWASFAAGAAVVVAVALLDVLAAGAAADAARLAARMALGLGLAALLALAVAAATGRAVSRRLAQLTEAADALAQRPSAAGVRVPDADAEVVRLFQALNVMGASLHALLERERSFTRYASHELRTPVGAIKVQLERVTLGSARAENVLPAVERQVARIEELIDALLTLARSRDPGGRTRPLPELLEASLDPLADEDRARVYVVEPVPDVAVREGVLVEQALRNLVDNAVRHGAGPVTVRVERDGAELTVFVRDRGPGVSAGVLRRLAETGERRPPRPDGHGLGLTLVQLIARALDGRLLLHNTETGLEASLTVRVVAAAPA